jgi:hypothetical protein
LDLHLFVLVNVFQLPKHAGRPVTQLQETLLALAAVSDSESKLERAGYDPTARGYDRRFLPCHMGSARYEIAL